jgi:hypothetical protein
VATRLVDAIRSAEKAGHNELLLSAPLPVLRTSLPEREGEDRGKQRDKVRGTKHQQTSY